MVLLPLLNFKFALDVNGPQIMIHHILTFSPLSGQNFHLYVINIRIENGVWTHWCSQENEIVAFVTCLCSVFSHPKCETLSKRHHLGDCHDIWWAHCRCTRDHLFRNNRKRSDYHSYCSLFFHFQHSPLYNACFSAVCMAFKHASVSDKSIPPGR